MKKLVLMASWSIFSIASFAQEFDELVKELDVVIDEIKDLKLDETKEDIRGYTCDLDDMVTAIEKARRDRINGHQTSNVMESAKLEVSFIGLSYVHSAKGIEERIFHIKHQQQWLGLDFPAEKVVVDQETGLSYVSLGVFTMGRMLFIQSNENAPEQIVEDDNQNTDLQEEIVLNEDERNEKTLNVSENLIWTIYPNPSSSTIRISSFDIGSPYVIYSAQGEIVQSGKLETDPIDIRELSNGTYILSINGETKRFVKE
ncbi:MAG: T9SS type A sorting domain-containing protein [Crocinitomicaceae bacterium]